MFRKELDRYVEELEMAKARLIESDKNVVSLEIKLA